MFAAGGALVVIFAALELIDAGGHWLLWEDIHLVLAPLLAAVVVRHAARIGEPESAGVRNALALAMALTAAGQFFRDVPDVYPQSATVASVLSDVTYVLGAMSGMRALMVTLYSRLQQEERNVQLLDGLIIMLTSMALVFAVWQAAGDLADAGQATALGGRLIGLAVMLVAASFFASAVSAALVSLSLRVRPRLDGAWAVLVGIVLIGLAWAGWLARFIAGAPDSIEVMDFVFAGGALLLGHGGRTWSLQPARSARYDSVAKTATEWLPMAAVVGAGVLSIVVRPDWPSFDPVAGLALVVLVTAMLRQGLTNVRERVATERLTREVQERAATSVSLARIEGAETPEATADLICGEALRLDGIDTAAIYAFDVDEVVPLAVLGLPGFPVAIGDPVPHHHGRRLRHHADFGLWIERWADQQASDPFERSIIEAGLAVEALVPLYWNEEPFGVIAMGTRSAQAADRLTDRLAALTEFSVVAGAVLGPMVTERSRAHGLRHEIQAVIDDAAFHPVYQPFIDLVTHEIVGYEALTRFDDGRRPDLRFADATAAGMSVELETACLRRQIELAGNLLPGRWLSLNASPELIQHPVLPELLAGTDRDVVVEVTEHVEISDYSSLVGSLDAIRGGRVRVAVDDAGAGYAGLRHILELRPEFVKLDISVVRSVDVDPSRQAMVAGMAFFATQADCQLIAEGIETEGELETLRRFGVAIGQGYLLGRPARVD